TFARSSSARAAGTARTAARGVAVAVAVGWASLAGAQSETPFGGFKHDASQPIQVSSDTLQVRNADQVAIFEGKVDVVQGAVRMRAQRLEVTYRNRGGEQTQPEGAATPGSGAIDRLQAIGDVLISNGKETAKAARADYDVAKGEILLTGDVILLQGENVVKGQRLVIDLATGTARMGAGGGRVQVSLDPSSADN
ncbi:MAG: lipopolysaccharide transport periplasmic protein LptA, partial [Pseudomonadota bacterium]